MCKSLQYLIFVTLFYGNASLAQVFLAIDKDTYEFVDSVEYSLLKGGKAVYEGVTSKDQVNKITYIESFDSIRFTKEDYETLCLAKSEIDSVVYLTKKSIYLEEVVINSSNNKEVVFGENNRIIGSNSRPLTQSPDFGMVLCNRSPYCLEMKRMTLYVEKVKLRTAYRINFSEVTEVAIDGGGQVANIGETFFSTDTQYLNRKDKNKIELLLTSALRIPSTKKFFVWIELLGYFDDAGVAIVPEESEATKLKFQMSKLLNYYSKVYHIGMNKLSDYLLNSNLMVNLDFAYRFSTAPHKSDLVAPAIVLYATKLPE